MTDEEKGGCCVVIVGGACLMLLCGGCVTIGEATYSTGYRDCVPQKLSQKGIIFHTWEGEAALSGARQTEEGSVPNLWAYTVDDDDVRKRLESLPPGTAVRMHYRQVLATTPWHGSTKYRITKVEDANKPEAGR